MNDSNSSTDKAQQFIDGIKTKAENFHPVENTKSNVAAKLDQVTDRASEAAKNVEDKVISGSDLLDKNLKKAVDTFDEGLNALDKWLSKF